MSQRIIVLSTLIVTTLVSSHVKAADKTKSWCLLSSITYLPDFESQIRTIYSFAAVISHLSSLFVQFIAEIFLL